MSTQLLVTKKPMISTQNVSLAIELAGFCADTLAWACCSAKYGPDDCKSEAATELIGAGGEQRMMMALLLQLCRDVGTVTTSAPVFKASCCHAHWTQYCRSALCSPTTRSMENDIHCRESRA